MRKLNKPLAVFLSVICLDYLALFFLISYNIGNFFPEEYQVIVIFSIFCLCLMTIILTSVVSKSADMLFNEVKDARK